LLRPRKYNPAHKPQSRKNKPAEKIDGFVSGLRPEQTGLSSSASLRCQYIRGQGGSDCCSQIDREGLTNGEHQSRDQSGGSGNVGCARSFPLSVTMLECRPGVSSGASGQLSLLEAEAFISDMRRPGALGETPDLIVIGTFEGGRPTFSETCRACFARELIHGVTNGSLLPERN
ncbi:hypothetical protein QO004_004864, partial [Rhizobium mesoamericanum]|nr:hypothetical protein [Rhizobium mesoamericanum]